MKKLIVIMMLIAVFFSSCKEHVSSSLEKAFLHYATDSISPKFKLADIESITLVDSCDFGAQADSILTLYDDLSKKFNILSAQLDAELTTAVRLPYSTAYRINGLIKKIQQTLSQNKGILAEGFAESLNLRGMLDSVPSSKLRCEIYEIKTKRIDKKYYATYFNLDDTVIVRSSRNLEIECYPKKFQNFSVSGTKVIRAAGVYTVLNLSTNEILTLNSSHN